MDGGQNAGEHDHLKALSGALIGAAKSDLELA
jgi:hypothetical protein